MIPPLIFRSLGVHAHGMHIRILPALRAKSPCRHLISITGAAIVKPGSGTGKSDSLGSPLLILRRARADEKLSVHDPFSQQTI